MSITQLLVTVSEQQESLQNVFRSTLKSAESIAQEQSASQIQTEKQTCLHSSKTQPTPKPKKKDAMLSQAKVDAATNTEFCAKEIVVIRKSDVDSEEG